MLAAPLAPAGDRHLCWLLRSFDRAWGLSPVLVALPSCHGVLRVRHAVCC